MASEIIAFHGMEIEATCESGVPFANLKRLCECLGLAYPRQLTKLSESHWATITKMVTVADDGKPREMAFISADTIPMWLATINARKVDPSIQSRLRVIQDEMKDVLYQYFGGDITLNGSALSVVTARIDVLQGQLVNLVSSVAQCQQSMIEMQREQTEAYRELLDLIRKIDQRTASKREDISAEDKSKIVRIVWERYAGKCPCCQRRQIVDEGKRIPYTAEFDHYHHRSMAQLEFVWLVCVQCNRKLRNRKPGGFWLQANPAFQNFQRFVHEPDQPLFDATIDAA